MHPSSSEAQPAQPAGPTSRSELASRRTKIVVSIGPRSETPAVLDALAEAGMDVARISTAHGSVEDAKRRITAVVALRERVGRPIAVMIDLPGPKIRLAPFPDDGTKLTDGQVIKIVSGDQHTADALAVNYGGLLDQLSLGDRLTVGDGALRLEIVELGHQFAMARVNGDRLLIGSPGLHILSERVGLRAPTPRDLEVLSELLEYGGVDIVAVSFVRNAEDVLALNLPAHPDGPMTVAKIETRAAVENLTEILEVVGGVMVARGDLGLEFEIEELPILQKEIIKECIAYGRPVITATQMLESMVSSPVPTRAEVTDVANAIFDGTSAVMLSGETAVGENPPLVVETMAKIAARADESFDYNEWPRSVRTKTLTSGTENIGRRVTDAISAATWRGAAEMNVNAIICLSYSGFTVRSVARFRPQVRIIGCSENESTVRQLCLSWGVEPLLIDERAGDRQIGDMLGDLQSSAGLRPGDLVAVAWGSSERGHRNTDSLRFVQVPD